jgi:hypothetical protein
MFKWLLKFRKVIYLITCGVTSPRIYKPSLCGGLLRTVTTVLIYCGINLSWLIFKLVRELYQLPFVTFITMWHQEHQDSVLHFCQKETSLLGELQRNLI